MVASAEKQEQRLLLLSASGTLSLSIIGVLLGLWTGAKSIVFDGMYEAHRTPA